LRKAEDKGQKQRLRIRTKAKAKVLSKKLNKTRVKFKHYSIKKGGNSFTMSATYISGSGCQPCLRNGNDSASASNDGNDCASANNEGND